MKMILVAVSLWLWTRDGYYNPNLGVVWQDSEIMSLCIVLNKNDLFYININIYLFFSWKKKSVNIIKKYNKVYFIKKIGINIKVDFIERNMIVVTVFLLI